MKKPRLRTIFLIAALLLAAGLAGLYFYLPAYVQNHLIPGMLEQSGVSVEAVSIRRISIWGADLGIVKIKGMDERGLTIKAIQVSYSPLSLLNKSIDTIELIGFSTDLKVSEDQICIAGFCISTEKKETKSDVKGLAGIDTSLPVQIERVKIQNGRLRLLWLQHELLIPFDIELLTNGLNQGLLEGEIALYPRDNIVTADLSLDSHANQIDIKVNAPQLAINRFSEFWRTPPGYQIWATADIKAHMKAQLSPMALNETEFSAEMADFLFRGNGLELGGLTDQAKDDPQPLSIQITGIGSDQWQLFCGPLVLKRPSIIQIPAIRADISRTPEGWRFAGRLKTLLPEQVLTEEWRLKTDQPLTVQWQFQANQEGRSRINYRLKGDTETALPFSLEREPVTIRGNGFHVEATGWVIEHTMNSKVIASTGPVEINAPPNRLHIPEVTLSADTQLTDKLRADSEITLSKPVITRDALSGGASSARISALVEIASNPDPKVTGAVGLTAGYIEDPKQNLSIRGIDVKMPFGLPIMDTQPVGTFRAKALRWHTYEKGRVKGDLVQTKGRLEINARYSSQLRPGLQMDVNGWIGQAGGRLAVEIPPYQPEKEIDLGQFVSSAAGFLAKGSLTGTGDFKIEPDGLKGSALITITNASLSQKDDALSIEGVSASLLMPQLPDLRSAPRQPLSADHIQLGEISAHDFNAFFQIEPPGTLFIEKADVQWCNGGIHTQSIRLHPDKQDIELTLFANQLNLAQVLEQLGVTEGEGEGAVNGRIPLRLHEGMPIFDNGFLYSTPGQGGTIHLRDTNSLLQGMPREAPQFIQLDIATEALKDYTYDWARLSLNSENDILKVGLKLKGKPNKLLPFTYDKETEQFRRINGEPIAEFKEIGFDLNFSSSLNQILQYKKMLNKK